MPRLITKKLRENMSSFKTKTIALIASSLIVAVAGLSFATTPAFAKIKRSSGNYYAATNQSTPAKAAATKKSVTAVGKKAPAKKKHDWIIK